MRRVLLYGGGSGLTHGFGLPVGVVGAAYHGAGLDVAQAHGFALTFVVGEKIRVHEAVDGQVVGGGLEVLADGEDVARAAAGLGGIDEFAHQVSDFLVAFADTDHNAGFGDEAGFFGAAEEGEGLLVFGLGADGGVEAGDGFEVVTEHIRLCGEDGIEGVAVAAEIGDEHFDFGFG